MLANRWVLGIFIVYAIFSSYVIYSSVSSFRQIDSPRLFIKDPNAPGRIVAAISSDHNMALVARTIHNKVLVSWQVVTDSVYRSLDIPFLFSLTERTAVYDNPGKMQMLPFYELPFFFIALIYFIRRWEKMKKYGLFLLGLFAFSLLCAGFLWPFIFPLKLIPLMITIQLFIFLGTVGFIEELLLWRRK